MIFILGVKRLSSSIIAAGNMISYRKFYLYIIRKWRLE